MTGFPRNRSQKKAARILAFLFVFAAASAARAEWSDDATPLNAYVGLSYGVNLGLNGVGRVNYNPVGPLYLGLKGRFAKLGFLDTLAGVVVRETRGSGSDSERTGIVSQTDTTTTYSVRSVSVRKRSSLLVVAGARTAYNSADEFRLGPNGAVGVHWVEFNSLGNMKVAEFNLFLGKDMLAQYDAPLRVGASLSYMNSIPSIPGFIFGLEAGYLPAGITYASLDLGWAFGS